MEDNQEETKFTEEKQMNTKLTELDKWKLAFSFLAVVLMFLIWFTIYEHTIIKQEAIEEGLVQAENNCIKFVCSNTKDCLPMLPKITNYCKSYVRGTDFYIKFGN